MTVKKAILRGHLVVNIPVLIIMIGTAFVFIIITNVYNLPQGFPLIGFGLGFILAWLYWSLSITKWKIWAFERVRNVHELKSRAILEGLIWKDDHIFGKTEIWSGSEKNKWHSIKIKFDEADIFIDDSSISTETIIEYKNSDINVLVLTTIGIIGGAYLVYENKLIVGISFVLLGIIINRLVKRKVTKFFIINSVGIKKPKTKFFHWSTIKNEKIIKQNFGKNTKFYLTYTREGNIEKIDIDKLEIDVSVLYDLLKIYRGRNNRTITSHNQND